MTFDKDHRYFGERELHLEGLINKQLNVGHLGGSVGGSI